MHQGGDYATSSYYQYDQPPSQFQNPNPNSNPYDVYANSSSLPPHASAPPISPSYSSSSIANPSSFSHAYPPYPQNPDHQVPVPNLPPTTASTSLFPPNPSNSSFDATNSYQQPSYYHPPYDQNQALLNYDPPSNSNPVHGSNLNPSVPSSNSYASAYDQPAGGFAMPNYESSTGRYESQYDNHGGFGDEVGGAGGGIYAYKGGDVEPYGARGTGSSGPKASLAFDDYGRPISSSNGNDLVRSSGPSTNVVKANPRTEAQQDATSGVQKFRVTLLAELGGSNMDVLCQIGLDGIRMLEPPTSRTLKIYPLETVTRWEVLDSSIFAFWSKSSVDIEPKRIRLKSNSYTTNTILDAVTAASIQFKEMDGVNKPSDTTNVSDQLAEKKKGLADWMNLMKPRNEEKYHWVPDEAVAKCNACKTDFGAFVRRHHCRNCGDIFCDKCTQGRIVLTADEQAQPVRVCDQCMAEVTQRLSNARETSGQVAGLQRHEDLAKKLQEEMDRKRQTSSGTKSGSRMQMREVACPTCTVHLEVEVPSSGSKTIECSICQHPFLVNAQ